MAREHLHAIRRADTAGLPVLLRVLPDGDQLRGQGDHPVRRRRPAQGRLVEDAQREHVEARVARLLPPAQGRPRVGEVAREAVDVQLAELAEVAVGDQRADEGVADQAVGAGDDHRGEVGPLARLVEHPLGLAGVHRHPRLRQHMLARAQRRQRRGAVQVGPGADDDGVDRLVVDQLLPAAVDPGDVELARDAARRFAESVADPRDLDTRDRAEAGDMPGARDRAGADDPDPYRRVAGHRLPFGRKGRAGSVGARIVAAGRYGVDPL